MYSRVRTVLIQKLSNRRSLTRNHRANPNREISDVIHRNNPSSRTCSPPIYWWDDGGDSLSYNRFNGLSLKTDESVRGCWLLPHNPSLKRWANPNRNSLNNVHRNNPPIYWCEHLKGHH